jgi:hypothetical protein
VSRAPEDSVQRVRRSIFVKARPEHVWRLFETNNAMGRWWGAVAGDGTLVELFHDGFERTGPDAADDHAAYEQGWGMTQLSALKNAVEN